MRPTDTLRHEHEVILFVLKGIERGAKSLREKLEENPEWLDDTAAFVGNFVNRCHHTKEGKLLLPRLVERGIPGGSGPIGVLLQEHEQEHGFLRAVAEATADAKADDAGAIEAARDALLAYVGRLRNHIARENESVMFTPPAVAPLPCQ